MSRGLGWIERRVLEVLADDNEENPRDVVAADVFGFWTTSRRPTRSQVSSFNRAVSSLKRKGLVEESVFPRGLRLADAGES